MDSSIMENQKIETAENDVMKTLLEKTQKQLFYTRILAGAAGGMFLILLIAALLVVPKAVSALTQAEAVMADAQGLLETADTAISNISAMSDEVTQVSKSLNGFVTDNAQTLTDAATDISNIDFEGLNGAIRDLQDAVGPFAKMMNRFK
jgi:type II secretory pathway component PulM